MKNSRTTYIVTSAVIAASYAALTYFSAMLGMAYGSVQFRISEALTILPILTPAAIPGLAIGCFLGNLSSPYGIADILLGTLATFIAALLTRPLRKFRVRNIPFLAPLPAVLVNALIIGGEITFFMGDEASFTAFLFTAGTVAFGQFVVCYGLGLPLGIVLEKHSNRLTKQHG